VRRELIGRRRNHDERRARPDGRARTGALDRFARDAAFIKCERRLPTGHGEIDIPQEASIKERAVQIAVRVIHAVAFTQCIKVIALPRMQAARKRERVKDARHRSNGSHRPRDACKFRIEKADIEGRVVNHQLRFGDESEQLIGDIGEAWLALERGGGDAVHGERRGVNVALGIDVTMKSAARRSAVEQFNAADFDDAVTELGLEARRLGVEEDLSHGARVYLTSPSIA